MSATDRSAAEALDAADPLAEYRHEFHIGDPEVCYLDGNSLGALPAATPARVADAVERQWGRDLVRSASGVCDWAAHSHAVRTAVGEYLGWPHSVFHSDEPDAHCLPLTVTACWLPWQETFAD